MTHYNTLNVKLSNSKINKLKSIIKDGIEMNFYQTLLVIIMMKLIFQINCY